MRPIRVYQHENKPDIVLEVEDRDRDATFDDVVTWRIIAVRASGAVVVDDVAPAITIDPLTPWKARVRHTWTSLETAATGKVYAEVEVTWPGGAKQTFRPVENAYEIVPSGA